MLASALAFAGCAVDAEGLRPPQGPADGAPVTANGDSGALDLDRVPVLGAGIKCSPGDAVVKMASGWECLEMLSDGGAAYDHDDDAEHQGFCRWHSIYRLRRSI